ncbi:MAG: hypothetical protein NXI00_23380 [Cytophagales bacterium]|nr:hypothetical protein [Cytophagales bacterium]
MLRRAVAFRSVSFFTPTAPVVARSYCDDYEYEAQRRRKELQKKRQGLRKERLKMKNVCSSDSVIDQLLTTLTNHS